MASIIDMYTVMTCSHRADTDKTRQFCLVRVGGVRHIDVLVLMNDRRIIRYCCVLVCVDRLLEASYILATDRMYSALASVSNSLLSTQLTHSTTALTNCCCS